MLLVWTDSRVVSLLCWANFSLQHTQDPQNINSIFNELLPPPLFILLSLFFISSALIFLNQLQVSHMDFLSSVHFALKSQYFLLLRQIHMSIYVFLLHNLKKGSWKTLRHDYGARSLGKSFLVKFTNLNLDTQQACKNQREYGRNSVLQVY